MVPRVVPEQATRQAIFIAAGRVIALVAGFILLFAGIGLGVTVVLLPAGLIIGVLGLLVLLWALAAPGFEKR